MAWVLTATQSYFICSGFYEFKYKKTDYKKKYCGGIVQWWYMIEILWYHSTFSKTLCFECYFLIHVSYNNNKKVSWYWTFMLFC